jgi:Uma2 family endonuclease
MATHANPLLSVREYLELLQKSDVRYEYWDGEVVAMAGSSARHNRIAFNINGMLWPQLKDGDCTAAGSDQLVREEASANYMFPDVVIHCKGGRMERQGIDTLLDPLAVFEILSPTTAKMDRSKKFDSYTRMQSLRHLVLLHQDMQMVEHHYRERPDEAWKVEHLSKAEDAVVIREAGAQLKVGDLYGGVEL